MLVYLHSLGIRPSHIIAKISRSHASSLNDEDFEDGVIGYSDPASTLIFHISCLINSLWRLNTSYSTARSVCIYVYSILKLLWFPYIKRDWVTLYYKLWIWMIFFLLQLLLPFVQLYLFEWYRPILECPFPVLSRLFIVNVHIVHVGNLIRNSKRLYE